MLRDALIKELDSLLKPKNFDDHCHNGLQLEGKNKIEHIVSAVSSSKILIDKAIELKADAILVHHGLFWKGDEPEISGMKLKRLRPLIENHINLIAYHLPLDAHPELGNNAELARLLNFNINGTFADINSVVYAFYGELESPMSRDELGAKITNVLDRKPLLIEADNKEIIKTVAWCSGGAQHLIEDAARLDIDVYISGEISEHTVHKARELGINYFAIGHHASERYGVQALADYLNGRFDVKHTYIELDNPV